MNRRAFGIDIGGTKTSVGLVDETGVVKALQTAPTPAQEGPDRIIALVARLLSEVAREVPDPLPIGVGSAGTISPDGSVASATDAIRDWGGFRLAEGLGQLVGRPVAVLNDVHAAAVAEARLGAGRRSSGFLMVTVGTGVGGAVVLADGLLAGATGTAGSMGHLPVGRAESRLCPCGGRDHVEAYASGPAMERTYLELTGKVRRMQDIAVLAAGGDVAALAALDDGADALGGGLAGALAVLDVDTIVIGGGVAAIGADYLDRVRRSFGAAALPGPSRAILVPAALGVGATLVGAALEAMGRSDETGSD